MQVRPQLGAALAAEALYDEGPDQPPHVEPVLLYFGIIDFLQARCDATLAAPWKGRHQLARFGKLQYIQLQLHSCPFVISLCKVPRACA